MYSSSNAKTSDWHPRWCEGMQSPSPLTDPPGRMLPTSLLARAENVTSSPMVKWPRYDAETKSPPRANSACAVADSSIRQQEDLSSVSTTSPPLRHHSPPPLPLLQRATGGMRRLRCRVSLSLAVSTGKANDGAPSEVPAGPIPRGRGVSALRPECVSSPGSSLPALFSCLHKALCGSTCLRFGGASPREPAASAYTHAAAMHVGGVLFGAAQLPRSPFMATAESRLHWSTGGAQSTLSKNRRLVVVEVTGGQREGEREGKRVWGEEEGNRFLDLFRNLGHRKNRCQRPPPQLPSKSTSHQHYTPGMYLPQ